MAVSLKPLNRQTMVITGATSGIGLVTARQAAEQGAKVVLAARSQEDLQNVEQELAAKGSQVAVVAADVGSIEEVKRIAEMAMASFGGFDTWVNDAGLSIWGRLHEIPEVDHRRLFETNFWGMVHGSLEAAAHFRQRAGQGSYGGAIINLGSLASDQAFPLQGMYCASKHAIKGFTDALRIELEEEGLPVSVTLIKPAGIDTPFPEHAGNYMKEAAKLPPPIYRPEEVAHAILHAAVHPERDIYVGSASKIMSVSNRVMPRVNDMAQETLMVGAQKGKGPARSDRQGSLYHAGRGLSERGGNSPWARPSVYTRARLHPWVTAAVLTAAGITVAGVLGATAGRSR